MINASLYARPREHQIKLVGDRSKQTKGVFLARISNRPTKELPKDSCGYWVEDISGLIQHSLSCVSLVTINNSYLSYQYTVQTLPESIPAV